MRRFLIMIIPVILLIHCDYSTITEDYNPDYQPELSVYSLISTDGSDEFVIVERTRLINEYDSLNGGNFTIIDDAEVLIINETDTCRFTFYKKSPSDTVPDESYLYKGMYLDLNNEFQAIPGKTYQLIVTTSDGKKVTGSTTVPGIPNITNPSAFSVIQKKTIKANTIEWDNASNAIGYSGEFFIRIKGLDEQINIMEDVFVYDSFFKLNGIDDFLLLNDIVPLIDTATVKIYALDQNSYDYASKTTLASMVGADLKLLYGGIGAFGSYSVDSVKVILE